MARTTDLVMMYAETERRGGGVSSSPMTSLACPHTRRHREAKLFEDECGRRSSLIFKVARLGLDIYGHGSVHCPQACPCKGKYR